MNVCMYCTVTGGSCVCMHCTVEGGAFMYVCTVQRLGYVRECMYCTVAGVCACMYVLYSESRKLSKKFFLITFK